VLDQFAAATLSVLAQVPNPGQGKKPPGSEKFLTILQWSAWLALGMCVLGVIVSGATMAVQHRHGQGGEHAARLGWVAAGCVVVGSASALVGMLV
jgi:hypothetical protein